MQVWRNTVRLIIFILIFSFVGVMVLHYVGGENNEAQFWCNVVLGIFSGAFITFITALVAYLIEKRKVCEQYYLELEKFGIMVHALQYFKCDKELKYCNTQEKDNFVKTIKSYIEFSKYDFSKFNNLYGDFGFIMKLQSGLTENERNEVYAPVSELLKKVQEYSEMHFKKYIDNVNESNMQNHNNNLVNTNEFHSIPVKLLDNLQKNIFIKEDERIFKEFSYTLLLNINKFYVKRLNGEKSKNLNKIGFYVCDD